ncbi:hypothetical protein H0A36_27110 [Endozoicomonas sp. SM1973]|uniref:Uncharacterized protein n=1 Tax=Spartinivicinus marinus TaxID=2994442 RepID=A0A853I9V8_9GAMM|nr:hypothetical protein [Spartinivicinus marinus]NYZ69689.1 hypothetical protein [Spartinivicinus marinus]
MKLFMSIRLFTFIISVIFLPIKTHAALLSFQVEDTVNPMLLFGVFSVDDTHPNNGNNFQPLIDWAFFDMEGIPGIHTPVDSVVSALAFINLLDPTLSTLSFTSTDTVIPPSPPSGNTLFLNPDNTWSSGNVSGNYIVRLISIPEPQTLALFILMLLACLIINNQKQPPQK